MGYVYEAVPEEVGLSSKHLKYIDSVMERAIREKVMKGMVTLVARHGKIAQWKAYGEADQDVPMEKDAIFRYASMSKPIGAAALMQLFDQGIVMPSDPIADYIREFADVKVATEQKDTTIALEELKRPITVHDLLTMTAGLTCTQPKITDYPTTIYCSEQYRKADIVDTMHDLDCTLKDMVAKVTQMPVASQPGERWDYSNLSSLVAGRIVEIVSSMDLRTYLKKYIFQPLEMKETDFFPPEKDWKRMPAVYACGSMERLDALDVPGTDDTRLPFGEHRKFYNIAAGLHGTALDYFRFAQMLCDQGRAGDGSRILSPNAVHMMTQNHIGSQRTHLYGHGWGYMMNVQVDYNTLFNYMGTGSFGWHGYWGSVFNVWPEKDLIAIFLSQVSPVGPSWKIQERFLNVVANSVL